jgi:hypothetical protein
MGMAEKTAWEYGDETKQGFFTRTFPVVFAGLNQKRELIAAVIRN